MNIKLIVIGKSEEKYLREAVEIYLKRLTHYINFEIVVLPDVKNAKNMSVAELKDKEAELILKHSAKADKVVLLDEKGKEYSSVEFSKYLTKQMNASVKTLAFVVGGAFGFSEKVYSQANEKLSISKMTFSHQMIRLLFVEQLYRAFTIIKGEPYHNE
ncbi:MAG: 23S rRNA (pseudouridine(1915)-N(3))-methyltransferase RlmH [Bacteroidales bacterium]|jgi:23S rRNA (pseudouridine1915-N3)-methyltransferase|nr:23S rRNA (pseudouridine(1915)-N(3))-methyltransferase RlmH [Bacteroidales bacterium]MBQ1191021.1 23S rRNA (pseudouridine(1915)-N(3))-methyltransferase RlmH [Bacteroidales bacterium]MBQ2385744.1 23S rRNA (pseudouridine(1915)-N(3))-methyltransferase RlmH [Bacteroidales bacterium]MEE0895756.1 23S rRNA (pseudouridine(1915)-N(3))-methyltransferase RlmH [Bacteroidales bacterium]MEE0910138.1 23S rRNA (pseudouridine(1915)-N(3))-methyltransferase RlmH [Bacteroidales bacterium]